MKNLFLIIVCILLLSSCKQKDKGYDASGTFEAEETIISAEVPGVIKSLSIEEGMILKAGDQVGYIDSIPLVLKRKQLEAQVKALLSKRPDISAQLATYEEQLQHAKQDQQRFINLLKADATTQKKVDDANAQVDLIQKQINAQRSALGITTSGISAETLPVSVQIEQINDQISRCRIINPVNGTVLTQYARMGEMTASGKPIYKIADLSEMILRAYVTGDQFATIKLHQNVIVFIDDGNGKSKQLEGVIDWISQKAEFTPKTIQTKDERANLVYATKIRVKNNGSVKIGMYGEVKF